jgi:hypothetical protein
LCDRQQEEAYRFFGSFAFGALSADFFFAVAFSGCRFIRAINLRTAPLTTINAFKYSIQANLRCWQGMISWKGARRNGRLATLKRTARIRLALPLPN